MRDAAAEFLAAMYNHEEPYSLAYLGPCGTGKTFLLRLINRFFQQFMSGTCRHIDEAISVRGPDGAYVEQWLCAGGYTNWGEALRVMLDTGDWTRLGSYRGDYFLGLDDILAEHEKKRELSASKLYEIFTDRHARRWTVVTGNYGLAEIDARLDPRIASRLIRDRNVCIELPATLPDYALRPKK